MKKNIKIANISFVLSIMVVLIHSHTLFINVPGYDIQTIFGENITTFIQLFINDGITRIAVPMFLIISGFLFFKNFDGSYNSYSKKIKSRVFSLLIPYIFWSGIIFVIFTLCKNIDVLSPFFKTVESSSFGLKNIYYNAIISSYDSPLWYVRYLFCLCFLAPQFYLFLKKIPIIFVVPFILWLFGIGIGIVFRIETVVFFSIGGLIGIYKNKYLLKQLYNKKTLWTIIFSLLWCVCLILRSIYYCKQDPMMMLNGYYDKYIILTGNIGVIFGLIAFWLLFDYIFKNDKIWYLSQFSFLIFVAHHPIVKILNKILVKLGNFSKIYLLSVSYISAVLTIFIIIGLGIFLKKYTFKFYNLITGNRS